MSVRTALHRVAVEVRRHDTTSRAWAQPESPAALCGRARCMAEQLPKNSKIASCKTVDVLDVQLVHAPDVASWIAERAATTGVNLDTSTALASDTTAQRTAAKTLAAHTLGPKSTVCTALVALVEQEVFVRKLGGGASDEFDDPPFRRWVPMNMGR